MTLVATYPAPWQDVPAGTDRSEPWLALTPEAGECRLWLRVLGEATYHNALTAARPSAAPALNTFWTRMSSPRAGDLVMEVSTPGILPMRRDSLLKGFGFLVCEREEYVDTDDEWAKCADEYGDQERPHDRIWYVQYGPEAADVCRWENCRFVALPKYEDEYRVGDTPPQAKVNGWRTW